MDILKKPAEKANVDIVLDENMDDILKDIRILADRDLIRSVLDNLIGNAIKYNKKEGQTKGIINISVEQINISGQDQIKVSIADNGNSILPVFLMLKSAGMKAEKKELRRNKRPLD